MSRMLTLREVAETYGLGSVETWRLRCERKEIAYFRPPAPRGGKGSRRGRGCPYYIAEADVLAYIERYTRRPRVESGNSVHDRIASEGMARIHEQFGVHKRRLASRTA